MKQDLDHCRPLDLAIEQDPTVVELINLELQTLTNELLSYHDKLLNDVGSIDMDLNDVGLNDIDSDDVNLNDISSNELISAKAHNASGVNSLKWYPIRLSRDRHEFLDVIREERSRNNAKKIVNEKTGNTAFEFFKEILFKFANIY